GGFQPGLLYELAYPATHPPIAGRGFAALRDTAAWLKHPTSTNPLPPLRYAYAYGMSQSGRWLRDFLYHGFNTDEHDRAAYDGVLAHIAGAARINFNQRWSVPRELGHLAVTGFPFADSAQTDPATGLRDGLLENPRVTRAPKIFYTNTSVEYVGGGRVAALVHVDPSGKQDLPLPANVRAYAFAGTQHGPGKFPPTAPANAQQRSNPNDYWLLMRALVPAMHHWVADGTPPPASAYPTLRDGTLVPVSALAFPAIPGVASPRALLAGPRAANPLLPSSGGAGTPLPLFVSQVDADGNERAGIRLPELAVPLATYTGWNFRAPAAGNPGELVMLAGSWIPFPATAATRRSSGDPRPSIEERYPSREVYLAKFEAAARTLIAQRYLLAEDLPALQRQAVARWDVARETTVELAPFAHTAVWQAFTLSQNSPLSDDGRYRLKEIRKNGEVELLRWDDPAHPSLIVKPKAQKLASGAPVPTIVVLEADAANQSARLSELRFK
ncbi:MAG: alpha/beta hydrolase domain-containing protein, partial [Verrucomicrobia bacterium]|nr:alpha/beta hydrolase domain-containing protein [Verrucomicrobiota bacterium]